MMTAPSREYLAKSCDESRVLNCCPGPGGRGQTFKSSALASPSLIIDILISPFHPFTNDFLLMSWDMRTLNVSATLNIFRVLARPGLCLPHATISTFNDLPVPLSRAFEKYGKADIRAVVLDKDDCFARPNENEVYKPYRVRRIVS